MQGIYLRKYGVETKINFILFETDGVDFKIDAAHAAGDTKIMKDEGAEANTTNAFVDEGQGYSITLSATEMQAARIVVYIADQGTKVWLDTSLAIETYGNASAMHAIDLDDAVRGGMTALPNAAADAAGGLPISDAGGLDMDAILVDTNEIQGKLPTNKFMGSSDGADDDGTLNTIASDVVNIDGAAMRGTDNAATAASLATAQSDLDTLTGADGATLATSQPNYAPAKAGNAMTLSDDAITSAKYDESTAFPVKSADSGNTQIARTGADSDTLETLSDQIDGVAAGAGQPGFD